MIKEELDILMKDLMVDVEYERCSWEYTSNSGIVDIIVTKNRNNTESDNHLINLLVDIMFRLMSRGIRGKYNIVSLGVVGRMGTEGVVGHRGSLIYLTDGNSDYTSNDDSYIIEY